MKKNKIIIAVLTGAFFVMTIGSCKKFVTLQLPKSLVSGNLVFEDDVTAGAAVNGLYAYVAKRSAGFASGGSTSGVVLYSGLTADEVESHSEFNTDAMQFQQNQIQADNYTLYSIWASMYQTVYRANAIIEGVSKSTGMTPEKKVQYEAEARFIRAFTYFYLVNTFGDIPLAVTPNYEVNANLPRSPQALMYDQIIEDLIFAKQNLSTTYPNRGRIIPNQYSATAMLARVYLYKKDWLNAETESTALIDDTGTFSLTPLNEVFNIGSTEAIWQLDQDEDAGGIGSPAEASTFETGRSDLYSMSSVLWNSFEANDARKTEWTFEGESLYFPLKYRLVGGPIEQYSTVLRLAEQFLIRAEARVHLNKLIGANSAEADINTIRQRAGLPNTTATSQEELLDAIEKERRSELFIEWGHRWYDLKRWGKLTEVLQPLKSNWSANDTIYPIPLQDYNRNPNLRPQNAGY